MPSSRRLAASKVNILTRHRAADDPELIEARREHALQVIEDNLAKALASAPPLRPEQIDRLRNLFRTVTDVAGAA